MVAVIVEDTVDYKSAQDLLKNNAEDGAWKGQFRDKFEERSDQIDQIQAGLNEEAALGNIQQAQQAQVSRYIIDPISGEVLETSDGFDSGLSVSAITSLIERGASDDEIAAALDNALTTIAGRIADDKKNAKKYLAHLQELLHVLELSMKQAGKSAELQNTLRQLQEKTSKLMLEGNTAKTLEFLRSAQLRQALTQSVQQSRQQVEFMRQARDMMRSLASQARENGLSREAVLQNLQQASRAIVQSQLDSMMSQLREAYNKIKADALKETDPTKKDALEKAGKELLRQASELKQLSKLNQDPNLSLKQFEQLRAAAEKLAQQASKLAETAKLGQTSQIALQTLAAQQQQSLQAMNARLAQQQAMEGRLNAAGKNAPLDALASMRASEVLALRNSLLTQQKQGIPLSVEQQQMLNHLQTGARTSQIEAGRNQEITSLSKMVQSQLERGIPLDKSQIEQLNKLSVGANAAGKEELNRLLTANKEAVRDNSDPSKSIGKQEQQTQAGQTQGQQQAQKQEAAKAAEATAKAAEAAKKAEATVKKTEEAAKKAEATVKANEAKKAEETAKKDAEAAKKDAVKKTSDAIRKSILEEPTIKGGCPSGCSGGLGCCRKEGTLTPQQIAGTPLDPKILANNPTPTTPIVYTAQTEQAIAEFGPPPTSGTATGASSPQPIAQGIGQ